MRFKTLALVAAIALLPSAMQVAAQTAQTADPLKAAIEKAVLTNPEVSARFNAYRASINANDAARAAYYPRLDLNASVGHDSDKITSRSPEAQSLNRTGASLTLTQLLWDGLGTKREVDRVSHERLARYFELLDVTEQTALEAARSYYDVQRFRRLVQLAEDNYVQHKYASIQIQSRFKAGVGRGVDLEQANARLALAESNLSTEIANLHDVTARYMRVVGEAPPKRLPPLANLDRSMPTTADQAMNTAIQQSPAVSASIEGLRATRSSAEGRRSVFQPRVEARVRSGGGNNFDGVRDQKRDSTAEITLNWNLFNGGGDAARVRQQLNLLNQATDQRDKTCRDTRQVSAIAFNDTRKLTDQLEMLDRNTLAIEKARDAYRQQFDIGQRSLLDLLNAENEVYTAKRSYANAEYDLGIAYARTHAAMNQLTTQVGVARIDPTVADAAGWSAGDDAPTRCPIVSADIPGIDRAVLDERARQIAATVAPVAAPKPAVPPEPAQKAATPVATPASAASQPTKSPKKTKKANAS